MKLCQIVEENPRITVEGIAEKMGNSPTRVRQLINGEDKNIGLKKKGYIKPDKEPSSKRIYYSSLYPKTP